MKNKKSAIFLTILAVLVMSVWAFAACTPNDPENKNPNKADFTVKVIGPDGKPFTNVQVQPCLPGGKVCFSIFKNVDENGVTTFNSDEFEDEYKSTNALEIHLQNLPIYLKQKENKQVQRGESVTIQVQYNLGQPEGDGNAKYVADTNQIDVNNDFSPYKVNVDDKVGYEIKFTSADQKIYFQFEGDTEFACKYVVYSVGDVDAKVTQLQGNKNGLSKSEDAKFTNDNASTSDKNFRLEFSHDDAVLQNSASTSWFELTLSNEQDVGKTFIVVFEYVADL